MAEVSQQILVGASCSLPTQFFIFSLIYGSSREPFLSYHEMSCLLFRNFIKRLLLSVTWLSQEILVNLWKFPLHLPCWLFLRMLPIYLSYYVVFYSFYHCGTVDYIYCLACVQTSILNLSIMFSIYQFSGLKSDLNNRLPIRFCGLCTSLK